MFAAAAVVWDGIAAVSKAPLDNKSCLFKNLAGVMAVLKDTTREVRAPAGCARWAVQTSILERQ
jgi:hypothetical protein